MEEYFPKGSVRKLINLRKAISRIPVPLYAANAGFFIMLSLVPMLVLLMSLLRAAGLEIRLLLELLEQMIPRPFMDRWEKNLLHIYENTGRAAIGLSAVTAFWSASRGVHSLREGLNAVYGVAENRGYFLSRGVSLLYTLAMLIVLLLTLVVHVFGSFWIRWLEAEGNLPGIVNVRFLLLLLIQWVVFALMYMAVPSCPNRFRDSIPGALLAALGWLVFSDVFSVYVEHFSGYARGSSPASGLALGMLWLYCCLSILFWGGAWNRYLLWKKKRGIL